MIRRPTHIKPIAVLGVLVCAAAVLGGEIQEYHSKHANRDASKPRRLTKEVEGDKHGVTEIGIERTPCFGTCPAYTFIARSDGSFTYSGDSNVKRKGKFTGKVSEYQFNQLARFIRESGYMELDDEYFTMVTDHPTVYTLVVMNDKKKTVSNYANAGPAKLWAIEQLIDKMMDDAKWDGDAEQSSPRGRGL